MFRDCHRPPQTETPAASSCTPVHGHAPRGRLWDSLLTEKNAPRSLQAVLRNGVIDASRSISLATQQLRRALGDLLHDDDQRLALAAATKPHTEFLASAVLAVSAWAPEQTKIETVPIQVAADGAAPGRPRSTVVDPHGPWQQARRWAVEMGAPPRSIDNALASAPGTCLLVPSSWLRPTPWPRLWGRAHRTTRSLPSW